MKNVELLVRTLEEAGVQWAFGIPSGPVLPLIEALRKSPIDYILTASETSAGFMAATVGGLTGVPGVCVSTLGPGATNLATGVGCAWLDRSPLIAITCNVATSWIERRIQMRIDHHALFKPITKSTFPLRSSRIADVLTEALVVAKAEPPGPVHLDLPEDVGLAEATGVPKANFSRNKLPDISAETFRQVLDALGRSRKPLVVTGLSFTRCKAGKRLLHLIEKQNLPFVSTVHAKGFLPEGHRNWVGVLGRARRTDVQAFIRRADLILAIGYDPIEINYEEWVGSTPVIHVSTEPAQVNPGVTMLINKAGDLDRAIESISEIRPLPNDWSPSDWAAHRQILEKSLRPDCKRLGPHHVLDILREKLPRDGILAYDVGAHTHQIATQWRTDFPWTCLATNGWSSMGYGMPAAYAAKLIYPSRTVVGVVGDGCFQMTVGELATARRLGLAVPIIVLNDGWLGLVKVKQERKGYGLSGVYLADPPDSPQHYFGIPCRAARDETQLGDAIEWGLSLNGPSVIEAFIDVEPYSHTVFD
ncbi:MAG: thiamine pyrophosphate-binding protein [Candidatus Binatia bacterium]